MSLTISSAGDVGDCVFLLSIIRQLPDSPHTLVLRPNAQTKAKDIEGVRKMFSFLEPLVSIQPYIKEFRIGTPEEKVDWASEGFRANHYEPGRTLMKAHLDHLTSRIGIGHGINGDSAWIENVKPSAETKNRIVINRTGRYRNTLFQWKEVVRHYRHRLLFIGLPHEWKEFVGTCGYVEHRPTTNLLEIAELIAGSELFIGNQSCANAVNEGLKHASIQESSLEFPDCIYKRDNGQFIGNGEMFLPDIEGSGLLQVRFPIAIPEHIETPPGGWQFEGLPKNINHPSIAINMVLQQHPEWTKEEARTALYRHNIERVPHFFDRSHLDKSNARYRLAMKNAGYA